MTANEGTTTMMGGMPGAEVTAPASKVRCTAACDDPRQARDFVAAVQRT